MFFVQGLKGRAISLLAGLCLCACLSIPAFAAPPVRVAVVPGGGSGMEQDVVDQISRQISGVDGLELSTTNPDWYVVCNIKENIDQLSGQIRYNGNILIKTVSGKVIDTIAVQKYNQDFSTSPGAPLNKTLVDRAAREVINGLANRAVQPIQKAVMIEMEGRNRIEQATSLAQQGKYDEALQIIEPMTPDFIEFGIVQQLHAKLLKDKKAAELKAHGGSKSVKAFRTTTTTTKKSK